MCDFLQSAGAAAAQVTGQGAKPLLPDMRQLEAQKPLDRNSGDDQGAKHHRYGEELHLQQTTV
jgi:hypothetical protein